jgi:hypothetical protein
MLALPMAGSHRLSESHTQTPDEDSSGVFRFGEAGFLQEAKPANVATNQPAKWQTSTPSRERRSSQPHEPVGAWVASPKALDWQPSKPQIAK